MEFSKLLPVLAKLGVTPEMAELVIPMLGGSKPESLSPAVMIGLNRMLQALTDKDFRHLINCILEDPNLAELHTPLYQAIYNTGKALALQANRSTPG